MRTMNNLVAVKPFKFKHEEKKEVDPRVRVAISDKISNTLVASQAVFDGPDGIEAGDTLYFFADISNHPASRKIMKTDDGTEFIVVDKGTVMGVSK